MTASLNALKLLRRKIRFLVDIVRNTPEIRSDHKLMRRLSQLCALLPIADRSTFEENVFNDYGDVAAVNMLASLTKASEMLNGLAEDFKVYSLGNSGISLESGIDIDAMDGVQMLR